MHPSNLFLQCMYFTLDFSFFGGGGALELNNIDNKRLRIERVKLK